MLQLLDPNDKEELDELRWQRERCGWSAELVEAWAESLRKQDKLLYWIIHEKNERIGHISLDLIDRLGDSSLADKEEKTASVTNFYIDQDFRGLRLASKAMDDVEDIARLRGLKALTVYTPRADQMHDVDIDYTEQSRIISMYERRGYKLYKEGSRWSAPDSDNVQRPVVALFLRKEL